MNLSESFQQHGGKAQKKHTHQRGKWVLWCNRTNINPFPSSIGPVLDFLTEQFHEGKQYTTLNSEDQLGSIQLFVVYCRDV